MEFEKPKIEHMGMGELRSYMCYKSNGNPKVCTNCPGLRTCTAGQRAMVLISDSENRASRTEDEISQFRLACSSGNPWGWLESAFHISKAQAKEKLIGWCKRYPAITKEYGGQDQLLKYRPFSAQEATSETKDEEVQTNEQTNENGAKMTDQEKKRETARKLCETAILSGNARLYLMNELGLTSHQASCRVTAWRRNYPDIFEKHNVPPAKIGGDREGLQEKVVQAQKKRALEYWRVALAQPDPVAYHMEQKGISKKNAQTVVSKARRDYAEELKKMNVPENDEISLTDFLDETEPEKKANPVQLELQKKHDELKEEKERLEAEIDEKQKRLVLISDQEDALFKVLEMFK